LTNEPNNVNCLNSRAIIEYFRRHYPAQLPELISGLPSSIGTMPKLEEFLCDENNWIPSSLVVKMFENARRITRNPEVAFSIGFESITHRDLGYAQRLFLTLFASPQSLLRKNQRLHEKLNKTKKITLISETPLRAVLRLDWFEGVRSSHDVCSYNRGIYSALPTLWGYAPAQVEESPCRFQGGEYCKITIDWGFGVGWIKGFLARLLKQSKRPSEESSRLLEEARLLVEKDKEDLKQRSDDLQHKVEILKAINTATQILVLSKDIEQVLEQTLEPIIGVLGFDRALIMVEDERREYLRYRHARLGPNEDLELIKRYKIPLSRSENLMVKVYFEGRAAMSQDPFSAGLNPQNPILRDFRPGPSIVCPLDVNERTIGILGVTSGDLSRELNNNDKEYVQIFANNIATAFERERLDRELRQSYEERARIEKQRSDELRQSYEGAVSALVKAIEVNDEETGDHSDRVSKISEKIARYLGYSEAKVKDIQFGCILHDVGKIGLASWLELKKPGPLTDEEYLTIKQHPMRGEEILKANLFFGRYRTIVRNHHERWDGKGYPDGLAGDSIPMEAQIVAIADAYDAMTTDRRYRKAMPPAEAVAEIIKCTGTQFSPKIAKAFLQLFEQKEINGNLDKLRPGV
jgi:putative nucleotidyltransferase with HDIG domain